MLLRLILRGGQITIYTLYYGVLFLFSRKKPAVVDTPEIAVERGVSPGAVILRRYLQRCGGGFIKLGQILAMRYDSPAGGLLSRVIGTAG